MEFLNPSENLSWERIFYSENKPLRPERQLALDWTWTSAWTWTLVWTSEPQIMSFVGTNKLRPVCFGKYWPFEMYPTLEASRFKSHQVDAVQRSLEDVTYVTVTCKLWCWSIASHRVFVLQGPCHGSLILRLLNLQLQRQRCGRLVCFYKYSRRKYFVLKTL
jgi:hypothetical protein